MPAKSFTPLGGPLGLLAAASLAGAMALAPRPAGAADLDPQFLESPAIQQQQVTFGSGWYVRGDLAATDEPTPEIRSGTPGSTPTFSFSGQRRVGYDASLGAGYAFTNSIRADVTGDYIEPRGTSSSTSFTCQTGFTYPAIAQGASLPAYSRARFSQCAQNATSKLDSYAILANAYYDFGTFYGITPYVGAGVGASLGNYSSFEGYARPNGADYDISVTRQATVKAQTPITHNFGYPDQSSSGSYSAFAYALMAGFSYQFYPHLLLDVGYRYLDLGKVEGAHYSMQQVHAGLRYMIDN